MEMLRVSACAIGLVCVGIELNVEFGSLGLYKCSFVLWRFYLRNARYIRYINRLYKKMFEKR